MLPDLDLNKVMNFTKQSTNNIAETLGVCNTQPSTIFLWWILPIILFILLLLIIRNRKWFLIKFFKVQSKRGLIKVILRQENKHLKEYLVKVDTYGNFRFKKRRYTVENLQDFIIGYDKHKFPVFFYDYQFILPLEITKKKIDDTLRKLFEESGVPKQEIETKISQFAMSINPAMLDLVYSRKLMSDLYSISGSEDTKKLIIYVVGGLILLAILYYTGLLEKILMYLGVDI